MTDATPTQAEQDAEAVLVPLLARFRISIMITAALAIIGILTGTVLRSEHQAIVAAVGFDLEALKAGRVWSLPAATLIPAQPGITWHLALLVLVSVGLLEHVAGSLRALVTFFIADWLATPLTTLALWGLATAGSRTAERLVHTPGTGPSAAAFGAATAAAVLLPPRWREASLIGLLGFLVGAFAFQELDVALAHFLGAVLGGAIGWFVWRRARQEISARPQRSSEI